MTPTTEYMNKTYKTNKKSILVVGCLLQCENDNWSGLLRCERPVR